MNYTKEQIDAAIEFAESIVFTYESMYKTKEVQQFASKRNRRAESVVLKLFQTRPTVQETNGH